jgi:hypothetical protein
MTFTNKNSPWQAISPRLDFRFAKAGYFSMNLILKRRKRRGIKPVLRNKSS